MRSAVTFLLDRLPYVGSLRAQLRAVGAYPAGHFYSPIPSRAEVFERLASQPSDRVVGVELRVSEQRELLAAFAEYYTDLPFPEEPRADTRYYFNQSVFCYADAVFLYSFLRHFQPRRIVEVGSGFSSAVMLDTVDRFYAAAPQITLIEPFTDALKGLLRSEDWRRITVIEEKVQRVPLDQFMSLNAGDLLFIDSSHVLKCGSDLHYLLFEVVPRLRVGTFVHFHDVFVGFEYPAEWLRNGLYWNEDYLLRAFLCNNDAWHIVLFNDMAVRDNREWLANHMPLCLKNPGGSLYLRRVA